MVEMALTLCSRIFPLDFLFFPVFVVVSKVKRLIVIFYRLPVHDNYHFLPIKSKPSVFIDFR